MTPIKLLKMAREVLVVRGWTKGTYARTADGQKCAVADPDAACFCAEGALYAVPDTSTSALDKALKMLGEACPRSPKNKNPIPFFNDATERTKEEVLAAYDRAINKAEGR